MLIQLSFVIRVVLKVLLLLGLMTLVCLVLDLRTLVEGWPWWLYASAVAAVLIEDKLSIERQHTLIFLPIKSQLSAFDWLEEHGYTLLMKGRNRRIYIIRKTRWYRRNEFVRISMDATRLRLKMENRRANDFEQDFYQVMQEAMIKDDV